jgi:hypothetical protein
MDELDAFYDVAFPLLESSRTRLEEISIEGISEPEKRLLWLFCSLVTVAFSVEAWRQPKVPDSGASSIDAVLEPVV